MNENNSIKKNWIEAILELMRFITGSLFIILCSAHDSNSNTVCTIHSNTAQI